MLFTSLRATRSFALLLLFGTLLVSGCASMQKAAPVPAVVGMWEYVVPNTPQGDAVGTLVITQNEAGMLEGEMSSEMLLQTVPLKNLVVDGDMMSFGASFDAGGQMIDTKATLTRDGDSMKGSIELPGIGDFPMTATRK